MTYQQKIKKLEELFDQIKSLFPESDMNLNIHDMDVDLPENWVVEGRWNEGSKSLYAIAERKDKSKAFDITLYCK